MLFTIKKRIVDIEITLPRCEASIITIDVTNISEDDIDKSVIIESLKRNLHANAIKVYVIQDGTTGVISFESGSKKLFTVNKASLEMIQLINGLKYQAGEDDTDIIDEAVNIIVDNVARYLKD